MNLRVDGEAFRRKNKRVFQRLSVSWKKKGPSLRRPYVGSIVASRHPNMKELIIQHAGRPYRVLFAFDPKRHAILLIGGDKTGNASWYDEFVPRADDLFDEHLAELKKEDQQG